MFVLIVQIKNNESLSDEGLFRFRQRGQLRIDMYLFISLVN